MGVTVAERRHQEAAVEVDGLGTAGKLACAASPTACTAPSTTSSASVAWPSTPVQMVPPPKSVEATRGNVRHPSARRAAPNTAVERKYHPSARSVAVIGSGVAGLVAAYALSARDRVTLFEADTRLGGHAHTHYVDRGDGYAVGVDSAFLVHNDRTYPTLCRLFAELGIATQETDMSMSVRDDGSGLEYAGARGVGGLFPSWSSLTRPRYLLMLAEVKRFHAAATRLLRERHPTTTVGDVPGPARLLPVLRRPFHDPAGGGGVVVPAG